MRASISVIMIISSLGRRETSLTCLLNPDRSRWGLPVGRPGNGALPSLRAGDGSKLGRVRSDGQSALPARRKVKPSDKPEIAPVQPMGYQ
eukprot:scaffold24208_cov51-Prasinocladus_malaysianus.AAC.3